MPNSLTLLRRHRPACRAHHPVDSYSTEAEERRHNWKKCTCKIYAHGTLAGVFKKFATKARDWERAREAVVPYLARGSWDPVPPELPPPPPPAASPDAPPPPAETPGLAVADAVKAFLGEHDSTGSAAGTIRKYRGVLRSLLDFSADLGVRTLAEWEGHSDWVRQLRDTWDVGFRTANKNLGVLKTFFELFVEDGVLRLNPARIKVRPNRAQREAALPQKNPFTDEELERMLAGCALIGARMVRGVVPRGRRVVAMPRHPSRRWTGEDLADFIDLSVYTGLRISDIATFDIARLTPAGEVRLRTTKNGNWVAVWIPEWLRARLRARAARVGPLIFGAPTSRDPSSVTRVWRRKLKVVWDRTGPWESKPNPHRFRHTFVRILLERGVPVSLIADLAGDSEAMIRKHYSAWMPGRQEAASRILEEAFRNAPRYHRG